MTTEDVEYEKLVKELAAAEKALNETSYTTPLIVMLIGIITAVILIGFLIAPVGFFWLCVNAWQRGGAEKRVTDAKTALRIYEHSTRK